MVTVGQKIFFVEASWHRRNDRGLIPATVILVGRVNYEVQDDTAAWRTITFRRATNLDVSGGQCDGHYYRAYLTKQDYLDEQERKALCLAIRQTTQGPRLDKLTLDGLRQIAVILKEGEDNDYGSA